MIRDPFTSRKILLGISGGIAAYKTAFLIRELVSRGAEIRTVMTSSAVQFITPLTVSALTRNPVIVNIFPENPHSSPDMKTWHIDYALWAELMIIAPATVNTIAKIAHCLADNALTTVVSALRCPLLIAPAADEDMYINSINKRNMQILRDDYNAFIIEPERGFLASGLEGIGRMASIGKIVDSAEILLEGINQDLRDRRILITAGPTYEDIDPVRFIGNRSSGKMGYSLAKAAYLRGARVTLISGPSGESIYPEINTVFVRSASEMHGEVNQLIKENEILIMSAAVADYTPDSYSQNKLKRAGQIRTIGLRKTEDIIGTLDKKDKYIVGFALETQNEIQNARNKLLEKNLDMIVVNPALEKDAGFEHDTNRITVLFKNGKQKEYPLASKFRTANFILNEIAGNL